jgi:hypothetical protein
MNIVNHADGRSNGRNHALFIESLGDVTLGGLLQRECPVLYATCRISVRVAIAIVDSALKSAILPSVEKV